MKLLITLLLFSTFAFSQNTILNSKRKIIKLNINRIDVDEFMKKQPKGVYYIQRFVNGRVKECKLIKKQNNESK